MVLPLALHNTKYLGGNEKLPCAHTPLLAIVLAGCCVAVAVIFAAGAPAVLGGATDDFVLDCLLVLFFGVSFGCFDASPAASFWVDLLHDRHA